MAGAGRGCGTWQLPEPQAAANSMEGTARWVCSEAGLWCPLEVGCYKSCYCYLRRVHNTIAQRTSRKGDGSLQECMLWPGVLLLPAPHACGVLADTTGISRTATRYSCPLAPADEELSTASGIPGCVFVHASGFIGWAATLQGALEMAKKALTLE